MFMDCSYFIGLPSIHDAVVVLDGIEDLLERKCPTITGQEICEYAKTIVGNVYVSEGFSKYPEVYYIEEDVVDRTFFDCEITEKINPSVYLPATVQVLLCFPIPRLKGD